MARIYAIILTVVLTLSTCLSCALGEAQNVYEINVHVHFEDFNNGTLAHLSDFGAKWVRMDIEAGLTETVMEQLHNEGFKFLAVISNRTAQFTTLEAWNNTILKLVTSKAAQYIDAWEIVNEPNGDPYIEPSTYLQLLKNSYQIIKNYTRGLVISGGLAPIANYTSYFHNCFNVSDFNEFDFFGLHLYGNLSENLDLINQAKAVTGKEVWITEIGIPSETENFSEMDQAHYLTTQITGIDSEVSKIFAYEMYDYTGLTPMKENYFGLMTLSHQKKPAFYNLRALNAGDGTSALAPFIVIGVVALVVILSYVGLKKKLEIQKTQPRNSTQTNVYNQFIEGIK